MSRNKKKNFAEEQTPLRPTKFHACMGAAACALGAILYGLAFTPVSIYGIIGGIACQIAALGFFRTQKKRNPLKWCPAIMAAAYVLLALGVLFMTGGIIWASQQT